MLDERKCSMRLTSRSNADASDANDADANTKTCNVNNSLDNLIWLVNKFIDIKFY